MGNILTRWWWGGDPDEVNELSGLSRRDVYLIQQSWKPLYEDAGTYGTTLFLKLFNKDPDTKKYFKIVENLTDDEIKRSARFRAHAINLMSAFHMAILNLYQPEVVTAMMTKLGDSHRKHRVKERDFETFKEILVEFFQVDIKVSPAVVGAWERFLTFIYHDIFEQLNRPI